MELPEVALTDGCLLKVVAFAPPAAAARSAEACDTLPIGTLMVLPACTCVDVCVILLPAADVLVDGVGILRVLSDEDERCLREGVGWVAPVIWCVGFGSDMSIGKSEAEVDVDECEALLATDADCARRAVSSRVSRLT